MATSILDRVGRVSLFQTALPILVTLIGSNVLAQSATPLPGSSGQVGSAIGAGAAPSEALQRQALGPYRMILRSAAPPNKPKSAAAHPVSASPAYVATAPRTSPSKPVPEPSQPASPTEMVLTAETPVTPIAAPTVQAVEAPVAVAAMASPPRAPGTAVMPTKTALVLVKNDPPALSGPLAREAPNGIVRVAFNVNPDGSTGDLKIATSNNRRLNGAVLAAISKWRYQPIDSMQAAEVEVVFSND